MQGRPLFHSHIIAIFVGLFLSLYDGSIIHEPPQEQFEGGLIVSEEDEYEVRLTYSPNKEKYVKHHGKKSRPNAQYEESNNQHEVALMEDKYEEEKGRCCQDVKIDKPQFEASVGSNDQGKKDSEAHTYNFSGVLIILKKILVAAVLDLFDGNRDFKKARAVVVSSIICEWLFKSKIFKAMESYVVKLLLHWREHYRATKACTFRQLIHLLKNCMCILAEFIYVFLDVECTTSKQESSVLYGPNFSVIVCSGYIEGVCFLIGVLICNNMCLYLIKYVEARSSHKQS